MKIKDMIETYSIVTNEWVHERKKDSRQLTDICNILNYDTKSTPVEIVQKIQYIIFNIQYKKDVLNKIEK